MTQRSAMPKTLFDFRNVDTVLRFSQRFRKVLEFDEQVLATGLFGEPNQRTLLAGLIAEVNHIEQDLLPSTELI